MGIGNDNRLMQEKKKRVGGYFTVEASCIYPFAIAVILLIIYMWFFMYDRCLMEQDFAGVLVKCLAQQSMNATERSEYMNGQINSMYNAQYLCWDFGEISTNINGFDVEVSAGGSIEFPFEGLNFWNSDNVWEADRQFTGKIYDRVFIIRTFRKIAGMFTN